MSAHSNRRWRRLAAFALLVVVGGCGGSDSGTPTALPDPDSPPEEPPPPPPPAGDLACQQGGYPCSPSGVTIAVLEQSDALGDSVLAMFQGGSSAAQAATWLEGRGGMAEVAQDGPAIRFRLEDGVGVWVLGEGALSPPGLPDGAAAPPRTVAATDVPIRPDFDVVSEGQEQKQALVLSAAHYDFTVWDDGPGVRDVLSATKGYEGGVTYLENATKTSTNVSIGAYKGWGGYDVVHVSSHGRRICANGTCRAVLVVNLLDALVPGSASAAERFKTIQETGVEMVKGIKDPTIDLVALNADFFGKAYPSGLGDTLVFLNACQTFGPQATDLVNALRGSETVVLGWSEVVYSGEATQASIKFYEEAGANGYPAEVAWDKMGSLRSGSPTSHGPSPSLNIAARSGDADLHVREIVTLLDPVTGNPLEGSLVQIEGNESDGVNDEAPFLVRVDGIVPEHAGGMMVHVTVNGRAAEPVPLTNGQHNETDEWFVGGLVPLEFDLTDDTEVTYTARVTLHSGGESRDQAPATLTGSEPLMGYEWEMTATHTTSWTGISASPYVATATITFEFEPGQPNNEPEPRYVATGGQVVFDYNHSYGGCTTSGPVQTFDLTPDMIEFAYIDFDTNFTPVHYSGYVFTFGPQFPITTACEESSSNRTHRAVNQWFDLQGDFKLVSGDRMSISDQQIRTQTFLGGITFTQQSDYTIERVR